MRMRSIAFLLLAFLLSGCADLPETVRARRVEAGDAALLMSIFYGGLK